VQACTSLNIYHHICVSHFKKTIDVYFTTVIL